MSEVSIVYVAHAASIDDVATKVSAAVGRGFISAGDKRRSEPGRPWITICPNKHDDEDGFPVHTFQYVVQVEASDARFQVARRIFDALRDEGLRLLLFDEPQGYIDQHEPDRASAAG